MVQYLGTVRVTPSLPSFRRQINLNSSPPFSLSRNGFFSSSISRNGFFLSSLPGNGVPLSSLSGNGLSSSSLSRNGFSFFSLPRNGFSPFRRILKACLPSNASRNADAHLQAGQSEIIFMGTGTSEGIPRLSCLTNPSNKCPVCSKAVEPGNKNRRLNTGLLICYHGPSGRHNILIDVGKFFYHSALRWFPAFGLRTIDAVIITHSHADAIGGLDDLRDWTNNVQPYIPIYVAERDFEVMKKTHYYLVDTSVVTPGAVVSDLQFNLIHEEPFVVNDLKFTPLPVWHGHGYRSLGFRFGNVCYISDVSEIPEETYPLLKDCELLIMDALRPDRSSSTHFGLPRAIEEVRKIQPRRTLFTGMMHLMDHDNVNEYLAKLMETEGLNVELSYDGLCVPVTL
ncbi:PREDICTED: putative hydrolase C777.06c [Populus euphratica]|uniref:Hydrolase C777.06c n=1 Tax=Populus euphratica TaxID=75702 RepID=A0AAJ6X0F4_POPEU|nr:PREDICTED: putative hydrolase C777.06c [Populus euphratica]